MNYIIIGSLISIILILIAVLCKYKRQVLEICRQLSFIKKHDSNMMISTDMRLGGMGQFIDELNDFLRVRKEERRRYLEKEKNIAETYTSLSHDIWTPLTSLDGYFQLLEQGCSEEEQQRYIEIIQERIGSLKDMLEELFEYTKLENDAYELEMTDCCVNRVLKDTVFSYYEEWKKRDIGAEFQITEELLYIEGNEQALRRVIQNIIKNGLDHGEKKMRIVLKEEQGQIRLEISNEVSNPQQIDTDRVFERFYKAEKARSGNSTGLGLAIAKELVLRMHGEIEAEVSGNEFGIFISFTKKRKK